MNEAGKGNGEGTSMPESLFTKLNRLWEQARREPDMRFNNLAYLLNLDLLGWSFQQLKKDAAAGVDGVHARDYECDLIGNLKRLHERMKANQYRAQSLRRVYIDKEDGSKRALSIPSLEDKIVQRAVAELLTRIYENDFLPCSYGYRPGRNAHDALDAIQKDITFKNVNFVLDADIKDYFGTIARKELMELIQKRVTDKYVLRLIGKWLRMGAIEDGQLLLSEDGVAQGSIISPLLANIYLHEVLDLWVKDTVGPRLRGPITIFRYADDIVATFHFKDDAERFMEVLPKRFEKFGLTLHPDKTRLIHFGRDVWAESKRTKKKPETFNFLGLTHYCGETQKGKFTVKVKTMTKRLTRALKRVHIWCKEHRHKPVPLQQKHLVSVLRGHYNYYGRRSNYYAVDEFYQKVRRAWKLWLGKRSADGYISWGKMEAILKRYPLPRARITQGRLTPRSQLCLFPEFV